MQIRKDNPAYFEWTNCEKDELQMAKVDYLHTNKDCNEARDELVMLCNELESWKARFFVVEFAVGYRKNYEAKLFE